MKNIAGILIMTIIAAGCSTPRVASKADFEPVTDSIAPAEGIFYNLPLTVIEVEITAQKIIEKRGPFYRYSRRYLDLSDVITEDRSYWKIKDAHISTTGTPDPERRFRIVARGTPAGAGVSLTPGGILKGFNTPDPSPLTQESLPPKAKSDSTPTLEDLTFDNVPLTEEQLIKTSSAATAEEVAREIYNLRNSRHRLLESDLDVLPPDDGAYKRVIENINKLEEQYLSLFRGKRETITKTRTFRFIPQADAPANQVLFRFSETKGFTKATDMSGTPVYIEVNAPSVAESPNLLPSSEKERSGLVYCRPARATVKIIDRTMLLNEKEVMIGQFGSLHQLAPGLLDNSATQVQMDPKTGALLQVLTNQ